MAVSLTMVLLLFCTWQGTWAQPGNSVCQSMAFRNLPRELQNEHQCMLLEKLQQDFEEDKFQRVSLLNDLTRRIDKLGKKISKLKKKEDEKAKPLKFSPTLNDVPLVRDCHELLMNGIDTSGVYSIKLPLGRILNVWCDMRTDNGGWTVIQRRYDGSTNFSRKWDDYTFGFGNPNKEYWFGNENLYQLTSYHNYTLRIDMFDWQDEHAFAEYGIFFIASEKEGFRLNIGNFRGTAGNSLAYHNDMKFTTPDKDNDKWFMNCAQKDKAGWWYKDCGYSSLNGLYIDEGYLSNRTISRDGIIKGMIWYHWKRLYHYSFKSTSMMIKPTLALKIERELFTDVTTEEESDNQQEEIPTEVGIEDLDDIEEEEEEGEEEDNDDDNDDFVEEDIFEDFDEDIIEDILEELDEDIPGG